MTSSNTLFAQQSRINRGLTGEEYVAQHVYQHGYKILTRNYRIRAGEIDIIAQKNDVIAFIEVKTRAHEYFNLSQVITTPKQRKIIAVARHYIFHNKLNNCVLRFDCALLTVAPHRFSLTYIPNAFTDERNW